MIIDLNNISEITIDRFYFENINNIKIIDIIRIDNTSINKLDLVLFKYYPEKNVLDLIPIILSYNNLPDISNINIGTIIKIPNLDDIFENLIILDENTDNIVQGVNQLKRNNKSTIFNDLQTSSKLNIKLRKVTYDSESGVITY